MEKIKKYKYQILAGILLVVGVCAIIWGPNVKVQFGIGGVCWGVAVFMMVLITRQQQLEELEQFDNQAHEILEDIATYGEESEYYQFYNIEIINNIRKKLIKKHKKQTISCSALGVVLIIIAIVCMF